MPSRLRLGSLPVEVLEVIAALLELRDLCSLRLTEGDVAAKYSQGLFKTHFRTKTIKLTALDQLVEFVCMTQPEQLGCLVEHLTLVGAPTSLHRGAAEQDTAERLGQAMTNLRLNSARGCLRSVSLVVESGGNDEHDVKPWEAASNCFHIAALALEASRLPIEGFDVFGRVRRCSLACNRMAAVLDEFDLMSSLKSVKQLSVSMSGQVEREGSEEEQTVAAGRRDVDAIVQFLGLCPELEDLQLHWYKLHLSNSIHGLIVEQRFFDRVVECCRFPSLKRCALQGIATTEAALLAFLRHVRLRRFEMEEVHLLTGTFHAVFALLAAHMEQLEYVHLDSLWETRLICFDAPGEPYLPSSGPSSGPNVLTRTGADARQLIQYQYPVGYALGTVAAADWHRRRRHLYGPSW